MTMAPGVRPFREIRPERLGMVGFGIFSSKDR